LFLILRVSTTTHWLIVRTKWFVCWVFCFPFFTLIYNSAVSFFFWRSPYIIESTVNPIEQVQVFTLCVPVQFFFLFHTSKIQHVF